MAWTFWLSYLAKLGITTLVLAVLYVVARKLREMRFFGCPRPRSIRVLAATMLSQHAGIYVLNVGSRYFVVGCAGAAIALLAELTPGELESIR